MATASARSYEQTRFSKPSGGVFTLDKNERSAGRFKLHYSIHRREYVRGDGGGGRVQGQLGWESSVYYQLGIRSRLTKNVSDDSPQLAPEEFPLVAWKFEFGAYRIKDGTLTCISDDSVKWRLFTRDGEGRPWSRDGIQGIVPLPENGASFLILTAMFPEHDLNHGPPNILSTTEISDPLFAVDAGLRRGETEEDKANELSAAAMKNDVGRTVELLDEYDPEELKFVNTEKETALHVASKCGSDTVAILLLKKCPSLEDVKSGDGEAPLQRASSTLEHVVRCRLTNVTNATNDNDVPLPDTETWRRGSIGFDLQNDQNPRQDSVGHTRYAKGLADALYSTKLPTPLTVGILGPHGVGKTNLLKLLTGILSEMQRAYRVTKTGLWSELKLLLLIIFYLPPPPREHFETNETDFIFVKFNAWEYAGSNILWAGIVTNLVGKIEGYAGYWKTRFFRIVAKPSELAVHVKSDDEDVELVARKTTVIVPISNFILLACFLVLLVVGVVLAALIGTGEIQVGGQPATNSTSPGEDSATIGNAIIAIEGAILAFLSMTVVVNIKNVVNAVATLIKSQKAKIESMVNKPNFADKLGYMADIKREVLIASSLINWIARYKKKPVRVVITVDDLDSCSADKAVDVIDAMEVLLSDENSPFICILAVDARIMAGAIEKRLGTVSERSYLTGHEYLKRFLQIRFCVPMMTLNRKQSYLRQLKSDGSENRGNLAEKGARRGHGNKTRNQPTRRDYNEIEEENIELLEVHTEVTDDDSFMKDLLAELDNGVLKYIRGCPRSIKNIYNLLCITAHLLKISRRPPEFLPSELVLWTVLLDQWPYRTTCMIHYIEDNLEKQDLGVKLGHAVQRSDKLKDIFNHVRGRLDKPRDWKMLVTLDGDPELFEKLLDTEMKAFDVGDVLQIQPYTIHLDSAIMYSIRQAQATCDIISCQEPRHDSV